MPQIGTVNPGALGVNSPLHRELNPLEGLVAPSAPWNPDRYSEIARNFQFRNAQLTLSRHEFRGDEIVLDIGSGDGVITATEIARRIPRGQVIGIDRSIEMLTGAIAKYPVLSNPNVQFIHGDAIDIHAALSRIEERENPLRFHVIFSGSTLHWLNENQRPSDRLQLKALGGIRERLLPGGTFLANFMGRDALATLINAGVEVTERPRWAKYFPDFEFPNRYSADHYRQLLLDAQLVPENVEIVDRVIDFESRLSLAEWMLHTAKSFMNRLANASSETQMAFNREMVDLYAMRIGHLEGTPISVLYKELVVKAHRSI